MADKKLQIRMQRPIPGVAYSQYEVQASGDDKNELQASYKDAENVLLEELSKDKLIVPREMLAKYLEAKSLTTDFNTWYKANAK